MTSAGTLVDYGVVVTIRSRGSLKSPLCMRTKRDHNYPNLSLLTPFDVVCNEF